MASPHDAANDLNPYGPPDATAVLPPHVGGSHAEMARLRHADEESLVRAVGTVNYVVAGLNVLWLLGICMFAFRHLSGEISAPWIWGWYYTSSFWVLCFATVFALVAARGLRALRPWAMTAQKTMFAFQGTHVALSFWYYLSRNDVGSAILNLGLSLTLLLPIILITWTEPVHVFGEEYARVIAATPFIFNRPKLPLGLKLAMACVFVTGLILAFAAGAFDT